MARDTHRPEERQRALSSYHRKQKQPHRYSADLRAWRQGAIDNNLREAELANAEAQSRKDAQ